jgi:hypothetical protein
MLPGGGNLYIPRRNLELSAKGFGAYVDGFVPFLDPLEYFGLYDAGETGMATMQSVGSVVFIGATLGAGAETRAGEAAGNLVSRNLYRFGFDRQGGRGFHFHLGPGKNLMKHHLPAQMKTWAHHAAAKAMGAVRSAINHMLGRS